MKWLYSLVKRVRLDVLMVSRRLCDTRLCFQHIIKKKDKSKGRECKLNKQVCEESHGFQRRKTREAVVIKWAEDLKNSERLTTKKTKRIEHHKQTSDIISKSSQLLRKRWKTVVGKIPVWKTRMKWDENIKSNSTKNKQCFQIRDTCWVFRKLGNLVIRDIPGMQQHTHTHTMF